MSVETAIDSYLPVDYTSTSKPICSSHAINRSPLKINKHINAQLIKILETDPDVFVPIKKLWKTLQADELELSLEEFQQMLQEDEHFEIAHGVDHSARLEADSELAKAMEQEMEGLGFYSGPRVKLASREMTAEDIFVGMTRSLKRMNQTLQSAWETRPPEDQETEDQLLEILAAGQRLEREIQILIDQTELSSDIES